MYVDVCIECISKRMHIGDVCEWMMHDWLNALCNITLYICIGSRGIWSAKDEATHPAAIVLRRTEAEPEEVIGWPDDNSWLTFCLTMHFFNVQHWQIRDEEWWPLQLKLILGLASLQETWLYSPWLPSICSPSVNWIWFCPVVMTPKYKTCWTSGLKESWSFEHFLLALECESGSICCHCRVL